MFPDIRARTARAVEAVERAEGEAASPDPVRRAAARRRLDEIAGRWVREMEALGVEAKGPWCVDFDNGSGYYCWRWPEPELAYFRGYRDGECARTRIQ